MGQHAFIIGGTGQIGQALALTLLGHGWTVTVSCRGTQAIPITLLEAGANSAILDRDVPGSLARALQDGADAVIDAIAFDENHASQLLSIEGNVGSISVISSISVYCDAQGRTLDEATDATNFPILPVPITESQATVAGGPETYSTRKVALERRLLDKAHGPIIILRPGAVYGRGSRHPREWWFVKRFLDGRRVVPLKYGGESRFSTTSARNLAALTLATLRDPSTRILNAVDPDVLTVSEIGQVIAEHMGIACQLTGLDAAPPDWTVGESPWSTAYPFVASDAAARRSGYVPVETYRQALPAMCDWLIAQAAGTDWHEQFPVMADYPWNPFDYDAEDTYFRASGIIA